MLRHKSTPCLLLATANSLPGCDQSKDYYRHNDLQDRYHDLVDQHQELKRQANSAQDQIRMLNTRLTRLIQEKKRYYRNVKSEREVVMEEKLYELEQLLHQQQQQNERLKTRLQLMRTNFPSGIQTGIDSRSTSHQTTTQTRIQSAYAHVQSKTDSGLGFYFRPLNLNQSNQPRQQKTNLKGQRAKSQTDLRPRSVTFQVNNQSSTINQLLTPTESESEQSQLQLQLPKLMQEAKEEILRLEKVVAQQQKVIDSFRNGSLPHSQPPTTVQRDNLNHLEEPNQSENLMQYTIMTTTTTSTSNLTTTATGPKSNSMMINGGSTILTNSSHQDLNSAIDLNDDVDQSMIETLWSKYQKILMHKESFQQVSMECQHLIENLYGAVKDERRRCDELREQLVSLQEKAISPQPQSTVSINWLEKDKIIETLRKENLILQNSLKQCMDHCLMVVNGNESNKSSIDLKSQGRDLSTIDQIQNVWKQNRITYEQKIMELKQQANRLTTELQQQFWKNESLKVKYEQLKELSENDQLKIVHLEEKVRRLNKILFPDEDSIDDQRKYGNLNYSNNHQTDVSDTNNHHSDNEQSDLDHILNSITLVNDNQKNKYTNQFSKSSH